MREPAPGLSIRVPELAFGGDVLLRDFSLELAGGRWSCLLGPSGSGKTSLLRMLAGLLEGGCVAASDGGPLPGRLAYMAQNDLLLPWLSVQENVILGWRLRRVGRAELAAARDRALELLGRVGLASYAGALPEVLSGGMRQRVALARTLMESRPIVLMDEPFSALDAITRHRLQDLAAELLKGRTVVLVTHSPLEALRVGHDLYVMGGRPAALAGPLRPLGAPPRDAADTGLLELQGRLLDQLAASAAAVGEL